MIRSLLVIWLLALPVLAGCDDRTRPAVPAASSPDAAGAALDAAGLPTPGGRIVMASIGEPSEPDRLLATDSASREAASHPLCPRAQVRQEPPGRPPRRRVLRNPGDGKLLRLLRENIRWTDGQPLTADDVEFTYRLMIDPQTPTAYAEDFKAVSQFRRTGPYSFEVRYAAPFARALATWMSDILPKHRLEKENLLDTKLSRALPSAPALHPMAFPAVVLTVKRIIAATRA